MVQPPRVIRDGRRKVAFFAMDYAFDNSATMNRKQRKTVHEGIRQLNLQEDIKQLNFQSAESLDRTRDEDTQRTVTASDRSSLLCLMILTAATLFGGATGYSHVAPTADNFAKIITVFEKNRPSFILSLLSSKEASDMAEVAVKDNESDQLTAYFWMLDSFAQSGSKVLHLG